MVLWMVIQCWLMIAFLAYIYITDMGTGLALTFLICMGFIGWRIGLRLGQRGR